MPYKLIIFDFDGTLADTFPWLLKVIDRIVERFHLRPIPPSDYERLRRGGAREAMKELKLPLWKVPRVARFLHAEMLAEAGSIGLFPGVKEMLEELLRRELTLALISSNSPENVRAILGPEITSKFTIFDCGASLFGKARKFRRAVRQAGVTAPEALCIGDELRDLESARGARIDFGAVAWGFTAAEALAAHAPQFLFREMSDIPRALAEE